MITYRSRFLTRIEVWFDDEPGDTRSADWILYNQRPSPVPGASCRYFYTYLIDLTQSREQLLAVRGGAGAQVVEVVGDQLVQLLFSVLLGQGHGRAHSLGESGQSSRGPS